MIIGNINDTHEIEHLGKNFKAAFEWLRQNSSIINSAEVGNIEIVPNKVSAKIQEVRLKEPTEQLIEVHKKYIDIHVPIDKPETIGWKPLSSLSSPMQEYDEDKDVVTYCTIASMYNTIVPGNYCIMFPSDGHAPIIGEGSLKKLCIKIRVEE